MAKQRPKRKHVPRDDSRSSKEVATRLFLCADEESIIGSDRSTVLVCASLIDRSLEMLLRHFFISRGASQEECDSLLTDGLMPPLSAFGIRIRIAKCLGLITRDVVPAFECVKDWRNHFAHEPIVEKLTAEVADELWGLIPERYQPLLSKARNVVGRQLVGKITPRWSFFIACSALDMMLLTSADVCFGNDVPGERD